MLEAPVFEAVNTIHYFQEEAFWNFAAFQAVFHTQVATLIVVTWIELARFITASAPR
jgi:hypothetical protein